MRAPTSEALLPRRVEHRRLRRRDREQPHALRRQLARDTYEAVREIVTDSAVASTLRLPALKRSAPSSSIVAEEPTVHSPIANVG